MTAVRRLLVIGIVIFFLGGLVAYQEARVNSGRQPVFLRVPGIMEPRVQLEPRLEKYYRGCGHTYPLPLPPGIKWQGSGKEEMTSLFPPAEGWRLRQEAGRLVATQEVDGLCPVCAPKRHLAVKDGLVAVYQGPAGTLGPLLKVTGLKISALPANWQSRIQAGEAEFNSEQELLEALDSLDEYR
ncbi:hypothetical protein [Neomoorella thermoacetica]|uniref:hypothetical protein n=1 Tax=Neomoorella thermoacetica TaxID=1525 RepID=UPI0030CD3760